MQFFFTYRHYMFLKPAISDMEIGFKKLKIFPEKKSYTEELETEKDTF